jgi:carbon-monoxide dehydrogenase catalytic subunit
LKATGDDISDLIYAVVLRNDERKRQLLTILLHPESTPYRGPGPPWAKEVTDYLFKEHENMYGGKWAFETDPIKMAQMMIEHIDKKRKALGIDKARERVLYDMAMRRELEK